MKVESCDPDIFISDKVDVKDVIKSEWSKVVTVKPDF